MLRQTAQVEACFHCHYTIWFQGWTPVSPRYVGLKTEILFKEKMNCGEEKVLKCPQITIREFKMSTVFVKEFVINKNLARKYDALKGLSGTNWDELDITEDIEN